VLIIALLISSKGQLASVHAGDKAVSVAWLLSEGQALMQAPTAAG
jgi:hypothetical protein